MANLQSLYPAKSSGARPVLQVDISRISTDWPHNLPYDQELYYDEHKEKRELDKTPPLIDDVSNEEKLSNLFKRLSNNPEEVDVVADFLRQRDATSSFSKVAMAEPAPAPHHADAPPLWAERTDGWNKTGKKSSCALWIKIHYGNKDPENWEPMGLTIKDLRHDKPLYAAFAKWIEKHPEDDFAPQVRRQIIRYTDPHEALERLRGQKRASEARLRKSR